MEISLFAEAENYKTSFNLVRKTCMRLQRINCILNRFQRSRVCSQDRAQFRAPQANNI